MTTPPSTPIPMAFCAPAPAPLASASGSTPKPNASDVMRIGRSLSFAASSVAGISSIPSSTRALANCTIRMAFFVVRPSVVNMPIWKYTSLGRPIRPDAITPPIAPRGSANRIEMGTGQLSYSAARHRKITSTENV